MMKIKVTSDQGARTGVEHCPYCSGLGVKVVSKETSKSCSSCKSTRKMKNSKRNSKPEEHVRPNKVSVVTVGNSSTEKNNKTPSLFGRLFSKGDKTNKPFQDFPKHHPDASSPDSFPPHFQSSVTLLEVRNSPKLTASNPNLDYSFKVEEPNVEHSIDNLCNKCNSNPAHLTVADSKGMKAERLCRSCHFQLKDVKKSTDQLRISNFKVDSSIKRSNSASSLNANYHDAQKTVILINDGKIQRQVIASTNNDKINETSTEEKLLKILEDLKKSVLQTKNIQKDPNITQTTLTKVTTKPLKNIYQLIKNEIEGHSMESMENDGQPVTVLSLSNNKVKRSSTFAGEQKSIKQFEERFQQPSSGSIQRSDDYFVFEEEPPIPFDDEDFDRPSPYNPDYRSTLGRSSTSSLKMPSELETVGPYQGKDFKSKAEEILQSNRSANIATFTSPGNSKPENTPVKDKNNSNLQKVYFIKSFGKYSEKIKPGLFDSPTTLKLGIFSHQPSSTNTLVITDPRSSTVQVFDMMGKCVAMIKVTGVKSSCQNNSSQLAVATSDWLGLYDFKGSEQARINLNVSKGGINSVAPMKTRVMFVMVAQDRMVSIFDCSSSITPAKTFERVNEKIAFKNIVDVSVTNKENLVILDAGLIGGTGAIYIIDISSGEPKSVIYPKHETCGPFVDPTAIAVDRQNRILISDSGNSRILLFSYEAGSQKIQVKTALTDLKFFGSSGSDVTPVGMDINNDDFIFLVVKGQKIAEIRIYSSH